MAERTLEAAWGVFMNTKNDVEVVINGKQYTMSGYESSEYLQKIATHINEKFALFKEQEGYSRLDTDMKYIMLAINLSDDYHKAQSSANDLRTENEEMGKEINWYRLFHLGS